MGPADAQAVVISDDNKYGPIGIIFALLSYLIAIGVVVIMGAVTGLVWQERSSGRGEAGQLPLPAAASAPVRQPAGPRVTQSGVEDTPGLRSNGDLKVI